MTSKCVTLHFKDIHNVTAFSDERKDNLVKVKKLRVPDPRGSVVEHREVVGSNPGRAIPKALKMVQVATLLGAQYYKASTGFSSPNKYRATNIATLTKKNSPTKKSEKINVCIHRRTVWKTGNHAKYVLLPKYRDFYYYYY